MLNCSSLFSCFRTLEDPKIAHQEALESGNLGNFEKAKQLYEKSIKLYEKKPENASLAKVYSDFASLHFMMGNNDEAIELFKKSLKFFEIDGCNFLDMAKVNLKIASFYCEKNELNQASSHIQDALEVADNRNFIHNHRTLVDIYGYARDLYKKMHDKQNKQYSTLNTSPLPISVENATLSPDSVHSDMVYLESKENIQQERENNYFSKHIYCLQKAIDFSCKIFLKNPNNRLGLYDVPNTKDEIKFLSNLDSFEVAFRENHNLNAEVSNEHKKTLMESLNKWLSEIDDTIKLPIENKATDKILEFKEKLLQIYEKLSPFVEDESKIEGRRDSDLPAPATQTSSRDRSSSPGIGVNDSGAGVFLASR
jgi:tetratricopeptide (TPR) repeat protein